MRAAKKIPMSAGAGGKGRLLPFTGSSFMAILCQFILQ
jgi:hypothetical protein